MLLGVTTVTPGVFISSTLLPWVDVVMGTPALEVTRMILLGAASSPPLDTEPGDPGTDKILVSPGDGPRLTVMILVGVPDRLMLNAGEAGWMNVCWARSPVLLLLTTVSMATGEGVARGDWEKRILEALA